MGNIPRSGPASRKPQVSQSTDFKISGAMLQSRTKVPVYRDKVKLSSHDMSWLKMELNLS